MKKSHYFILGGILAVLLLCYGVYAVFASPTVPAQLISITGSVLVDMGSGYEPVTDDMELKADHKIKTQQGEATLVLHESIIVDLEPNTEVVVDDLSKKHLKLSQPTGSTWTKFTKITGVQGLDIATPETVATVRGTFFGVRNNRVMLGEGKLDARFGNNVISLTPMQKAVLANGAMSKQDMSAEDRDLMEQRRQKMLMRLQRIRNLEVSKHKTVLKLIQKRYGWDKNEVMRKLSELDNNNADLNALEKQAPVRLKAMKKVVALTEEIREMKKQQLPPVTGAPQGGTGTAATAECPGGENCCCQYGFPDCGPEYECRRWSVPGKQYFGTCVKKGTNPAATLQLHPSQPAFCGK